MKLRERGLKNLRFAMGLLILLLGSIYMIFEVFPRIGGRTKIPSSQIIREAEDVCVLFLISSGASEEVMVATAYCHTLNKKVDKYKSVSDIWEEEENKILSWDMPMECPTITLKYDRHYQSKVISVKQDPICNAFVSKNPLKTEEIVSIRYIVDGKGQLVELEKKTKMLKPSENF